MPQLGDDRPRRRAHGARLVHRFTGLVEQTALQVLPHLRREEIKLPRLDRGDETGPEDRPPAEAQLRLLVDVILVPWLLPCQTVSQPKCLARFAFGSGTIRREDGNGGVVRARLRHPFLPAPMTTRVWM